MPRIKLDRFSVAEIKDEINKGMNLCDIAQKHNVTRRHINKIKNGERWAECFHCEEAEELIKEINIEKTTNINIEYKIEKDV